MIYNHSQLNLLHTLTKKKLPIFCCNFSCQDSLFEEIDQRNFFTILLSHETIVVLRQDTVYIWSLSLKEILIRLHRNEMVCLTSFKLLRELCR